MRATRGTLFLVVGASAAGKDTLIDAARAARPDIIFPRRVVVQPDADSPRIGEAVDAVSPGRFDEMAASGAFALWWHAHGLGYGVPAQVSSDLAAGRDVMVNVSRTVIDEARRTFAPLRILVVTASVETRAKRLAARGRETPEEIESRLRRGAMTAPEGPDVITIHNDGAPEPAIEAFLTALQPVRA